jgi:hypothetical protein
MNSALLQPIACLPYPDCCVVSEMDELSAIFSNGRDILIWERETRYLQSELCCLRACWKHNLEWEGSIASILKQMAKSFSGSFSAFHQLHEDIIHQASFFSTLYPDESLRVKLMKISDTHCAKFHTDFNELRLLCTYIGAGTEWIASGSDLEKVSTNTPIYRVKTGDVVLLKGAFFPGDDKPCFHRSPSIMVGKEHRLLLRIDLAKNYFE